MLPTHHSVVDMFKRSHPLNTHPSAILINLHFHDNHPWTLLYQVTFFLQNQYLLFLNKVTSCRSQIIIQEFYLETSSSSTMRLVTASTRSSLQDLLPKDFVWHSTSNHLFTPYEMYCSTLRSIDINGGSLTFVNNSHYWLVIKRCLSMFDYKS